MYSASLESVQKAFRDGKLLETLDTERRQPRSFRYDNFTLIYSLGHQVIKKVWLNV